MGKKTYNDFLEVMNADVSEYGKLTELEATISAYALFDYFISSTSTPEFRKKFRQDGIGYIDFHFSDDYMNSNLEDAIDGRYFKYGDILSDSGDKWEMNFIDYLLQILKGTKNKLDFSSGYPLNFEGGAFKEVGIKIPFIDLEISNFYKIKILVDDISNGKTFKASIRRINKITKEKGKEGCYIATMVYGGV